MLRRPCYHIAVSIEQYDSEQIRCPRLGGDVIFQFCRTCDPPFCHRIIVCWAGRIDIGTYLAENFSAEQIYAGLGKKPDNKLAQILKAAEKSKKNYEC